MKHLFSYYGENTSVSYFYKIIDEKDMKTLYIREEVSNYEKKYYFNTLEEIMDFLIEYKENTKKIIELTSNEFSLRVKKYLS